MEKAVILIDGGYLNRVLKNYFTNAQINYLKLSENIVNMLSVNRLRTYVYHCLPIIRKSNKDDEKRHDNMQQFLTKLKRLPRFEVKLGKLQLIGGKFKQKMVDVLMSIDIIKKSIGSDVKHIVLIAGDADFVPAIRTAKDSDVLFHLFCHLSSVHKELLDEIDELHEINEELINSCKINI